MEKNRRSGGQSGVIVKNKSSSGCLIVRKKSEDVCAAGSSGAQKVFHSKKEKKRPRMVMSDSGSSDELLMPPRPRRRVGPETIRVCNGLNVIEKGVEDECEFDRKKDRAERVRHTEDGLVGRNEDRKRNRLDVFEFDEYDGEMMMRRDDLEDSRVDFGRRRFSGSTPLGRTRIETEFESSSSRHVVDKRKKLYFEGTGSFNQGGVNRFGTDRDSGRIPTSLLRENYMEDSDEPIRLQGKNGVLKVMANKKKKVGEPVKKYDRIRMGVEENRSASRAEDNVKRNISIHSPSYLETEVLEKPGSFVRTQKNEINLQKSVSSKKIKDEDSDSEDSDTALKLGPKRMGNIRSTKEVSSESEKTPGGKLTLSRIKEGKVKRGSGTEKQKLRERIRGMLVDSGWKIDYRPRKNRDYLDAVYINPSGTAYWSIIKAYDALMKQLNEDEDEGKPSGDDSPFTPLPDEVLGQLTRKTRKKFEKEMKKKQRDGSQRGNTREASARKALSARHAEESIDSHEEKLSSFLKQGAKSSKNRMNENDVVIKNLKGQSSHDFNDSERPSSASVLLGRKSRKLGRCTLLVRGSNEGPNSDSDGFVPYSGKRTLLSWLIDSGTVQLSQKVQYMNRRKTKVMLEGWITRDGIHCGCCSKILTVLKFEIHAGSTLRQPFQNIYVDSGVSLLQCQIDAWNKLEESERIGFQFVDIEGDDPNDDTCGICGDGGNLICCDGCPSTFHQNCLNIQMLPPGDWHCPNCTCKFCGLADEDVDEGDDTTASELPTCSMCEKKYHILCMQETDALAVDSNSSAPSFCGQKCRELFEQLQKYLGVKHELESGFSWSLIHRTVEDSDMSLRGLPQRVECNSKLAVAMTVMDECFLPIVDRRSGINLIHNVLYNSGSNFNRLNYSGFYTAILERGDELISAASIRFHGTQLAEMPFIGTRHIYRRQGMCRRLFSALQSALCSLKVEKLIIPAIAELMHTWTGIFGFTKLEDSLKLEMLSLNMLVFPGIDMLQKWLLEKENIKDNITARTGSKQRKLKVKHGNLPELVNKSDMDSSADHDTDECADGDRGLIHGNAINGEVSGPDNESKSPVVQLNDTPMHSGSLNVSLHVSVEGAACDVSPVGDKLPEAASDGKCLSNSDMNDVASELKNKPERDSPVADISPSTEEGDIGVVHAVLENKPERDSPVADISPSSEEGDMDVHVELENKPEQDSPVADISPSSEEGDVGVVHAELENKPERDSPVAEISPSSEEGHMGVVHAIDVNVVPSHEAGIPVSSEETKIPDSESRNKLPESDFDKKGLPIAYTSHDAMEQGNKPESDSLIKDKNQFTIESDMDDAHMVNANVAAPQEVEVALSVEEKIFPVSQSKSAETAYDKNTIEMENKTISDSPVEDNIGSFKGDMDVNAAASHEVEIPVSVDGTICSDSKSRDKFLETPNRPVLDSVDGGTRRQRDGDTDDSCAKGNNVAAAHEHKIPVSVAGSIISGSQSKDIVSAESYLEKKCLIPETSHYKLQMEHTPPPPDSAVEGKPPPLDSAVEDKPPPLDSAVEGVSPPPPDSAVECKPTPVDSAVECKPHPEPALSSGQIIAENNTELSNENPVSSTMDSDNQITCHKKENKLSVTSEAGSEAAHREESCPHPGCDSIQSDTVEGKTGSSAD